MSKTIADRPVPVQARYKKFYKEAQGKGVFLRSRLEQSDTYTPFRKKSKWTPLTNREPALENYIASVEREIHRQVDQRPPCHSTENITIPERRPLSSLRKRLDIVIKPADKGSAMVVMLRDDYLT